MFTNWMAPARLLLRQYARELKISRTRIRAWGGHRAEHTNFKETNHVSNYEVKVSCDRHIGNASCYLQAEILLPVFHVTIYNQYCVWANPFQYWNLFCVDTNSPIYSYIATVASMSFLCWLAVSLSACCLCITIWLHLHSLIYIYIYWPDA